MTQKQTVLQMLEQAGPEGVTSNQFYAACLPRFSARIHELRREGFNVVKEPVEQGHFRYILVSHGRPEREADHPEPVGLGDQLHQPCSITADEQPREDTATLRAGDAPGQLFEVIEDGPTGPVNPYEWEAA